MKDFTILIKKWVFRTLLRTDHIKKRESKIEILTISILFLSSLFSLIYTSLTNYIVEWPFYTGFGGLILVILIRFKNEKYSNHLLLFLLFLGVFGLINFSHINYFFGMKREGVTFLKFQPIILILFLFQLILNLKEVNLLLGFDENQLKQSKEDSFNLEVDRFSKLYANKSREELQRVIDNPNGYVKAAVFVAQKLIDEKQ